MKEKRERLGQRPDRTPTRTARDGLIELVKRQKIDESKKEHAGYL